jgi:hypothetical protein
MKLDSAGTFNLHCHNDTCFLASQLYTNPSVLIYVLSTNGGETWEEIPYLPAPRIFKHNSNALHRMIFDFDENKRFYEVSYDFFKTSERYQDAKLSLGAKDLLESPIDTNLLISVHEGKQSTHTGEIHTMSIQISRNAGRNWEILKLFRYSHGFTTYQFNFDWAEKGHWFYKSGDGYDDLDYERQPDKYFETFDNGKTFREIKFNPSNQSYYEYQFGLDGKQRVRRISTEFARGITTIDYTDTLGQNQFMNWLYIIDPSKPTSNNIDSGYRIGFFTKNGHYNVNLGNNHNIFIAINENIGNLKSGDYINSYGLFTTTDNGYSWQLMNDLKQKPYFKSSFLDQGTNTLWIHVKDEPWQNGKHSNRYKGSLWKLKLPWGASSVENLKSEDGFSVYPNPAREYIEIFYGSIGASSNENNIWASPNASSIMLFNTLGESVIELADVQHLGDVGHLQRIDISHLPNGVYFVKITINNQVYVKKIMVFK